MPRFRSATLLACLFSVNAFGQLVNLRANDAPQERAEAAHPWAQVAKLKPSSDQQGFFEGTSVAISGDTVAVGQTDAGIVLVYVKPAKGWTNMTQTAVLIPSEDEACNFGAAVSISGDTIVVGGPRTFGSATSTAQARFTFS